MTNTEQSILKALAYFNIFNYPLKRDEIYIFLDKLVDYNRFDNRLASLCNEGIIHKLGEFYSLQKNNQLAERRKAGNQLALEHLKTAARIARFLYLFPFVKGVAVSGSLSKNYADKNSDIDFFIITANNRLWMTRTLMHLFKKLTFLTGSQHLFCMNYYIDEQQLEIKEKNIFTAVETMTLLPLQGHPVFRDFFAANKWAASYFASYPAPRQWHAEKKENLLKVLSEKILNNSMGDKLNKWFMHITVKRWKKKAIRNQRSYLGELMGLDGGLHYAKPDPANFQKKILNRYEKELAALMTRLETARPF